MDLGRVDIESQELLSKTSPVHCSWLLEDNIHDVWSPYYGAGSAWSADTSYAAVTRVTVVTGPGY